MPVIQGGQSVWATAVCALLDKCPRSSLRERLGRSGPVFGLDATSQFHAFYCETDTTLMLLAAPSHMGKRHAVVSQAVQRNSLYKSTDMVSICSAFTELAARRRASRVLSLLEQLSGGPSLLHGGSPSRGSFPCEKDFHRALYTSTGCLHALERPNERRGMFWMEEKHMLDEDKGKVQLLLKHTRRRRQSRRLGVRDAVYY